MHNTHTHTLYILRKYTGTYRLTHSFCNINVGSSGCYASTGVLSQIWTTKWEVHFAGNREWQPFKGAGAGYAHFYIAISISQTFSISAPFTSNFNHLHSTPLLQDRIISERKWRRGWQVKVLAFDKTWQRKPLLNITPKFTLSCTVSYMHAKYREEAVGVWLASAIHQQLSKLLLFVRFITGVEVLLGGMENLVVPFESPPMSKAARSLCARTCLLTIVLHSYYDQYEELKHDFDNLLRNHNMWLLND